MRALGVGLGREARNLLRAPLVSARELQRASESGDDLDVLPLNEENDLSLQRTSETEIATQMTRRTGRSLAEAAE